MNATSRVCVVAGVVAAALVLGGSLQARRAPKPKVEQPPPPRIVGEWKSDPFESSMGRATQTFCFRADGTVAVNTVLPSGPVSNSGTYALETDRVTLRLVKPESSSVLRVSFSGERLVLTDESGQARFYTRGSNGC